MDNTKNCNDYKYFNLRCRHPTNLGVSPLNGVKPSKFLTKELRQAGKFKAWLFNMCGAEGKWFKSGL